MDLNESVQKEIICYLKTTGKWQTDEDIIQSCQNGGIYINKTDIESVLKNCVELRYIETDGKNNYRIGIVLGSRPPQLRPGEMFRLSKLYSGITLDTVEIPEEYENPDVAHLARKFQGKRGTCTGFSGSFVTELLRYNILKKYPTEEQIAGVKRDVMTREGAICDDYSSMKEFIVSMECIYQLGRARATPSISDDEEGGYIQACAESLKSDGVCNESLWQTANTTDFVYKRPLAENSVEVKSILPLHKIDGWAYGESLKEAQISVLKNGSCWLAIPMYANYTSELDSGDFPDPGNFKIVGYHAVCMVGWTKDRVKFLNHWKESPFVNTISKKYFNDGVASGRIQMITPIDYQAVSFLEGEHAMVDLKSNVDAKITLSTGDSIPSTYLLKSEVKLSLSLDIGGKYDIKAESVSGEVNTLSIDAFTSERQSVVFDFSSNCDMIITTNGGNGTRIDITDQNGEVMTKYVESGHSTNFRCKIGMKYSVCASSPDGLILVNVILVKSGPIILLPMNFEREWAVVRFFKRLFGFK